MKSRVEDVQSLCNKRRGSLRRRVGAGHRPVQAVHPEPMSSTTFYIQTSSPASSPHHNDHDTRKQSSTDEERRKWRPSLKARVCTSELRS